MLFSNDLKWHNHIKHVISSVSRKTGLLYRLRAYLSRRQMESVYTCVIRPALEYGSVIYDNCSINDAQLL